MSITIYLDESGDLGWSFHLPYGEGGSSRFLTIASVAVPPEKAKLVSREMRALYAENRWNPKREKKWSEMGAAERAGFAERAKRLASRHSDIRYYAIVVHKQHVPSHMRAEPDLLYNHMLSLSLLDVMASYQEVTLVPDPRTVKIRSGNSQHDYLQSRLWFDKDADTKLVCVNADSKTTPNLQFADMLAGSIQSHFEQGRSAPWRLISSQIVLKRLFFEVQREHADISA